VSDVCNQAPGGKGYASALGAPLTRMRLAHAYGGAATVYAPVGSLGERSSLTRGLNNDENLWRPGEREVTELTMKYGAQAGAGRRDAPATRL